uniref:N-acetyltransferase n=1 Tax=Caldilinea aerophila TaxID=133453 RepID=A0A7C1JI37_9CHLR
MQSAPINGFDEPQAPTDFFVHPSADVSPRARIGKGTRIWNRAQVREGAVLGERCNVGRDVYIDFDVQIGNCCKIQNSALIYHGAVIEDGVFIGPQACLTNDRYPRAINPDGSLKGADDWEVGQTVVRYGASIGAGAIIVTGVEVGRFAMVGAGAVVTHDVPAHGLVVGTPARLVGYVCACGTRLEIDDQGRGRCPRCQREIEIGAAEGKIETR